MEQYKKEQSPTVKAAIISTLGELKATKYIPQLKQISSESNNELSIRALVSLSMMIGESMNNEERRESSLKLCQLSSLPTITPEGRRLIAIGLRNLKVSYEKQVLETLLKLLQDEDLNVRLEAGKTLTVLKFA